MGRITEAFSAINSDYPLDKGHYFHIDIEDKRTREDIVRLRKRHRKQVLRKKSTAVQNKKIEGISYERALVKCSNCGYANRLEKNEIFSRFMAICVECGHNLNKKKREWV